MAATIFLVHRQVYALLEEDVFYAVDLGALRVTLRPEWAADSLALDAALPTRDRGSLLDRGLASRVAEAYEGNPWVESVERVERIYPDRLRVRLRMRRPTVAVETPGGYVLLDRHRFRLPGVHRTIPDLQVPIVRVIGLAGAPPEPGLPWDEPGLSEALDLARELEEEGVLRDLAVDAIDVGNVGGRRDVRAPEIVVWAEGMVPIQWGRSSLRRDPWETPVERKLENLRRVLAVAPRLEGIQSVKVQFQDPYLELIRRGGR